ncbi:hypothetical protein J4416_04930 [Candidatus Pacearchaeota archaeon]|nr:hypothetical protein [Candidatus Pacearchaeota archaeon]
MSEILTVEVEDYEGIKKLYEFCELTRDPQNHLKNYDIEGYCRQESGTYVAKIKSYSFHLPEGRVLQEAISRLMFPKRN